MKEFAEALAWTILGIILDRFFDYIIRPKYQTYIKKYQLEKQKKFFFGTETIEFIKQYYLGKLYNCKIGNTSVIIPFLTNNDWNNIYLNVLENTNILKYVNTNSCKYPVRKKIIQNRIKNGQRIFNNSSLFLHRVEYKNGNISFEAGEYDYFQRISYVHDFEVETYNWIHKNVEPILRHKFLPNLDNSTIVSDNTVPFGCDIVLAIKIDNDYRICIHERSNKTINYPGGFMVVPSFGFGGIKSVEDNPLYYSFIKEYCEELFDREEMDEDDNHVNPYWFYRQYEEVADLEKIIANGKFSLNLIGCGFDAIEGFFNISLLARIEDVEMSKKVYNNCKGNWETSNHNIKFVSIKSNELEELLQNGKICPSSAFAISRAMQYLM